MTKAADISDDAMLRAIYGFSGEENRWAMRWDVARVFADVPEKVVYAKFYQLKKRGLVDGCQCGCRGDYCLTLSGADKIGVTVTHDGV